MGSPRTTLRAAALAACLAAALAGSAAPAAAQTRLVLGMGDQSLAMLDDPRFAALGIEHMRLVVPYDVATDPAQLARYGPILDASRARGIHVLVAFAARPDDPSHLPGVAEYTAQVRAFRARFPWIRGLTTWNEANHKSQPTARHPGQTGRLFDALARECRGCRLVAADLLDQAGFERWVRRFRRTARRPRIWGLHNYVEVNRAKDGAIARLRRATGLRGQVWLTETGGVVRFARSFGYDERRAARATRFALRLAVRRKVRRVYLYQWTGAPLGARWDSGVIAADGRPRPALNVIERYLRRPVTPLPPIPRVPRFPVDPTAPSTTGGVLAPDEPPA